jgi:PKD repeat protein
MRRIGFLLFCLTCLLKLQSQDLSNKGRDFWITYPAHVDSTTSTLGIYITSDVDASGSVQAKGINIPFSITANTVKRVFIGPGGDASNSTVYLRELDSVLVNSAVHVTANRPVVVYGHIIRQARSGASLILPSTVWGREYLVPSYQSTGQVAGNSGLAAITVVAKDTNTVVEITPKVQSYNGKRPAGLPYTITLINPGDVYQVIYQKDADISGTVVKSVATNSSTCKPIGVFSSTTWSAFDCTAASGGDNLFQQLFPTRAFGKSFLTAPFINRNYDIIRVFVTDPTTVVTRKEKGVTTTLSGLQANSFYEIKTNLPNAIDADKPVSVVQYITSQSCYQSIFQADPEMVILSPTEQTINNITVFSAHQNFVPVGQSNVNQCYLNIIIKTAGAPGFKINGSPPKGSFVAIPGTGYSFLQEDVSVLSSTNPVQTLKADSNFSAIAYGYGNVESYGYNAGTNVRDLYQFITLKNQYATVNFPATCVNTPFQFYITLPYQATKLVWQFNKQFPDITVNNPVPDSTYQKDNKTLYQFRLTNTFSYPSTGTFPVTVIATNASSDGCDGEQQIDYDLQVFEKPKAKFNWQHTGCVTDAVTFSDTSRSVGSIVNRWNWQFGDNTGSTLKNPVKLFSNPGSYTVKESIITDIGCQADSTATINVSSLPVALFTAVAPFCANSKLVLKDASTIGTGTINKWYWDYGNGKKDTLTSSGVASAVYSTPGNYTINLIVQAVGGCTSKAFTQTIAVSDKPVPDFQTPQAVCLPKGDAKFINQSTISNFAANPLTYNWDFGDGSSIDTATNPLHVFITAGPFTVKLTATSKAGCAADSTKIITSILAQPIASFTGKATVCLRDSSIFTDASTTVNQTVVKYYWDRGNGTIDSSKNQAYIYQLPGTFNVKHWVVTDKGCVSDTVT